MLPIVKYQDAIKDAVRNHYVTIVSAETGSGKSTQIPKYLAEEYDQIIVTEPRIMAAKTLANRVANEMDVTLGEEVGYKTGYDKYASTNSKIVFCTDGLQLVRTILNQDNQANNVLVIDEVHEWNLNIETLIAWCKFMQGKWNTKVVIMSATLDTETLAGFFGDDVAVLNVPGTLYEVEVEERPEYEFIGTIKEQIIAKKNVLVFVAGKKEIQDTIEKLEGENATTLPLHGELDWEEQRKCFERYPNSKVIVATNIAQTSITIPDIDVVVDSGEARISIARNGIQGLYLQYISQADIMQRKGRAGRTKNGKYYLCSNAGIEERKEYTLPEIQRSILDRVVLQLAAIGLDAEELEFYHQPKLKDIANAKKELTNLGALSDNNVTELGCKMVRIPVSVQFARMIIEAEKYNVTEQVMTIAAIIEMGGLLAKGSNYSYFTQETRSDLLAELDVWNFIIQMGYIDFKKFGINKKNFFKIKEHIKKLRETLYGLVEFSSTGTREDIVKSCICGLISHIYIRGEFDSLCGIDGSMIQLDRNSCMSKVAKIIVGMPRTIEFKDRWGFKNSLELLKFASQIDVSTLIELVPNAISEETHLSYSNYEDAVEITTIRYFEGVRVDTEITYDKNHPEYAKIKAEYEAKNTWNCNSYEEADTPEDNSQKTVVIDGKEFYLFDSRNGGQKIKAAYIDVKTIFTTNAKEVTLDSGEKVYFSSTLVLGGYKTNVQELKKAADRVYLSRIRERLVSTYSSIKVNFIEDVIENAEKIGKIQVAMNNGGYGDTPVFMYGYIKLNKKTVTFKIGEDEELANSSTLEALQYLFLKEVERNYGASKFSHETGKKRKILTDSEMKAKSDFDSLVRELMPTLTIGNIAENLEFLEEFYQELVA